MIINCPKCGVEFDNIGRCGFKKFCSRKCANSRIFSADAIEKKRIANTGKKYSQRPKLSIEHRNRISLKMKQKFAALPFEMLGIDGRKKRVRQEQNGKCNRCGIKDWLGELISLEVDHRDGNKHNNNRENLEGLCPNCHSLTSTWRGRNTSLKNKVSDNELIIALKTSDNIAQALTKVGMSPRGSNYKRARKILNGL